MDSRKVGRLRAGGDIRVDQSTRISNFFGRSERLPLVPPFTRQRGGQREGGPPDSLLNSLRASEGNFKLIGRDDILSAALDWLATPASTPDATNHRVMVIHGPGGAGKTRLAAEILDSGARLGWVAGFLEQGASEADWARIGYPDGDLIVAVDYAEARQGDLLRLFAPPPLEGGGTGALRVVLVVREAGSSSESWWERLAGPRDLGPRAENLLAEEALAVVSLEESLPRAADRSELWSTAYDQFSRATSRSADCPRPPAYLTRPLFERPLFVLIDAYDHFAGAGPPGEGAPPAAERLLDRIVRHERHYWDASLADACLHLSPRRVNEVAVIATLVGGTNQDGLEDALRALEWLRDDDALRTAVVDWWCGVYSTPTSSIRGVEPDIVGEYMVVTAMGPRGGARDQLGGLLEPSRLTSVVEAATLPGRQRILRVLTRIANEESSDGSAVAKRVLAETLARHMDAFIPSTFETPGEAAHDYIGVGESLGSTVASAVLACGELTLVEGQPENDPDRKHTASQGLDGSTRHAGLAAVRTQIERVARRELERGTWTIDRYAEIALWATRLDLEAGEAERVESRVSLLSAFESPPSGALAHMLFALGHHYQDDGDASSAEAQFQGALSALRDAGEEDSVNTHIVMHALADVALERGAIETATDRFDSALDGKRRLLGSAHPDTINSLLRRLCAIALTNVDAAADELEAAAEQLAREAAPPEQVARLRDGWPGTAHSAARIAEHLGDYDLAETLYQRALVASDSEPSMLTYVTWHDLGDVAVAQNDPAVAIERYQRALEGKRDLRDPYHVGTIVTMRQLALAHVKNGDPSSAVALSDELAGATLLTREQEDEAAEARTMILAAAEQFAAAADVARHRLQSQAAAGVRRAILDAAADPLSDSAALDTTIVDDLLLAVRVFPPGDSRLRGLAFRLHDLRIELTGTLVTSQMNLRAYEQFGDSLDTSGGGTRLTAEEQGQLLDILSEAVPDYALLVDETLSLLTSIIAAAPEDRALDPVLSGRRLARHEIADDRSLRRWLFTAVGNQAGISPRAELATLMSFLVGVRAERIHEISVANAAVAIWSSHHPAMDIERARVPIDLAEVTGMDIAVAERLTEQAIADAVWAAGRQAEAAEDYGAAEYLYLRAKAMLAGADPSKNAQELLTVWHDLGDVALACSDAARALECYDEAFNGRRRILGAQDDATLTSMQARFTAAAFLDVHAALARLRTDLDRLVSLGVPSSEIDAREIDACVQTARVLALREPEAAAVALRHALAAAEWSDPVMRYVVLHDLGDVEALCGRLPEAIGYYSQAYTGKHRLRGPDHPDTVTTAIAWGLTLMLTDAPRADKQLELVLATLSEPDQRARLEEAREIVQSHRHKVSESPPPDESAGSLS